VKLLLIAALGTVILAGCESSPPKVATQPPPAATAAPKMIQIISDPPGARIEINDDYVGDAPISITVPTLNGNFAKGTTIRAIPSLQGNYLQAKFFDPGMAVPSRILFDMGLAMPQ
jgi:PEGA domain